MGRRSAARAPARGGFEWPGGGEGREQLGVRAERVCGPSFSLRRVKCLQARRARGQLGEGGWVGNSPPRTPPLVGVALEKLPGEKQRSSG